MNGQVGMGSNMWQCTSDIAASYSAGLDFWLAQLYQYILPMLLATPSNGKMPR